MKIKQLFLATTLASFAISFNSCKKSDAKDEFEMTFQMSADEAMTDNFTEDASDMFMEVAVEKNVAGSNFVDPGTGTNNFIPCATVTVTPLNGFPKTIVIDFGTQCIDPRGNVRSGKINIVISDSVRKPGSTAVMTFNNYFVNYYKVEGTYTWTNTSTPTTRSWNRVTANGKITAPDQRYWLHEGSRTVTQIAGVGTLPITDDVFSVYPGTHTITYPSNVSRTITVLEAVIKRNDCSNVSKGKIKVQGPNHYATIDFGDGTCDNLATLSIDGRAPRVIILR